MNMKANVVLMYIFSCSYYVFMVSTARPTFDSSFNGLYGLDAPPNITKYTRTIQRRSTTISVFKASGNISVEGTDGRSAKLEYDIHWDESMNFVNIDKVLPILDISCTLLDNKLFSLTLEIEENAQFNWTEGTILTGGIEWGCLNEPFIFEIVPPVIRIDSGNTLTVNAIHRTMEEVTLGIHVKFSYQPPSEEFFESSGDENDPGNNRERRASLSSTWEKSLLDQTIIEMPTFEIKCTECSLSFTASIDFTIDTGFFGIGASASLSLGGKLIGIARLEGSFSRAVSESFEQTLFDQDLYIPGLTIHLVIFQIALRPYIKINTEASIDVSAALSFSDVGVTTTQNVEVSVSTKSGLSMNRDGSSTEVYQPKFNGEMEAVMAIHVLPAVGVKLIVSSEIFAAETGLDFYVESTLRVSSHDDCALHHQLQYGINHYILITDLVLPVVSITVDIGSKEEYEIVEKQKCPWSFCDICLIDQVKCATGYIAVSNTCVDINECDQSNACPSDSTCQNYNGGFSCNCNQGYTSNGSLCEDINECDQSNACPSDSTCENYNGGFSCNCNQGYTSSGSLCEDINECDQSNACPSDSTCENYNGGFSCNCNQGYTSSGSLCEDINECDQINACPSDSTCENYNGGFSCSCNEGYKKIDGLCEAMTECEKNNICIPGVGEGTLSEEQCQCNGHGTCSTTGICMQCELLANAQGDSCQECAPGFTGTPLDGSICTPLHEFDIVLATDLVEFLSADTIEEKKMRISVALASVLSVAVWQVAVLRFSVGSVVASFYVRPGTEFSKKINPNEVVSRLEQGSNSLKSMLGVPVLSVEAIAMEVPHEDSEQEAYGAIFGSIFGGIAVLCVFSVAAFYMFRGKSSVADTEKCFTKQNAIMPS